ncbi:hypothetical protein OIO90_004819 [Microbotryomycetes sp. JL221]|nr:hypothetical protein OIO90_004819 [Microbotryomycetes sp. JL221]
MFKLFGGIQPPSDQVTPKASQQANPFDTLAQSQPNPQASTSSSTSATSTPQRTSSVASLAALLPSGAKTPTVRSNPSSASHSGPPGGSFFASQGSGFQPTSPGEVTPGGAAPVTPGGLPTTEIGHNGPASFVKLLEAKRVVTPELV